MGPEKLIAFFVYLLIIALYIIVKGIRISRRKYYIENSMFLSIVTFVFIVVYQFMIVKDSTHQYFFSNIIIAIIYFVFSLLLLKNIVVSNVIIEIYSDDFEAFLTQVKLALEKSHVKYEFINNKFIINNRKTKIIPRLRSLQLKITDYKKFEAYDLFLRNLLPSIESTTVKSKTRLYSNIIIGLIVAIICVVSLYVLITI